MALQARLAIVAIAAPGEVMRVVLVVGSRLWHQHSLGLHPSGIACDVVQPAVSCCLGQAQQARQRNTCCNTFWLHVSSDVCGSFIGLRSGYVDDVSTSSVAGATWEEYYLAKAFVRHRCDVVSRWAALRGAVLVCVPKDGLSGQTWKRLHTVVRAQRQSYIQARRQHMSVSKGAKDILLLTDLCGALSGLTTSRKLPRKGHPLQ